MNPFELQRLKEPYQLEESSLEGRIELGWLGPPLDQGPLPALFYFALSLEDSLQTEPFCTPARLAMQGALGDRALRVFSVTLPSHRFGENEQHKLLYWQQAALEGSPLLSDFLDQLALHIEPLLPSITNCCFSGLSRGAWVAAQIASRLDQSAKSSKRLSKTPLLLFAPMSKLFDSPFLLNHSAIEQPLLEKWNLDQLLLAEHPLWISIGHCDERVGTDNAIDWLKKLNQQDCDLRGEHQLVIYPSIGYKGHGTPPPIFAEALAWLNRRWSESASL